MNRSAYIFHLVHRLAKPVLAAILAGLTVPHAPAMAADKSPRLDVTFLFSSDIHACRMAEQLSPHCAEEGKTDANLLRHIKALNMMAGQRWPDAGGLGGQAPASAGQAIAPPRGLVIGGDITDDGGGQLAVPGEGYQLRQFSQRYQEGVGPDRLHMPVYVGLGNHDLDQDGARPHVDWYRREMRDYVEINHRASVFFKPPVPADNYDVESDNYSWNWGRLHLVQLQRFGGDTRKGAVSGMDWLKQDLADSAADGRPVIVFQHYGWDRFSTERWDTARMIFDDAGGGADHWWSDAERSALLDALKDYNVIGLFHGHEHDTPMIYRAGSIDLFKPKAAFKGGFAVVRVTDETMDVALGEATDDAGAVTFTNSFSKSLIRPR